MIMLRLRTQTAGWHARAERAVNFHARLASIPTYRRFLQRLYGFYLPLEAVIHGQSKLGSILDLDARRKTHLLEADLLALGTTAENLAAIDRCTRLPLLADSAAAAGSLYVLEGASLGGQIIARHLAAHLGITPKNGGSFFQCYGPHLKAMWSEFGAAVERTCDTATKQDGAIQAAIGTFECFTHWFEMKSEDPLRPLVLEPTSQPSIGSFRGS
jgi:heme oxygenase (biliverdin-IX-beta and delta-forming)